MANDCTDKCRKLYDQQTKGDPGVLSSLESAKNDFPIMHEEAEETRRSLENGHEPGLNNTSVEQDTEKSHLQMPCLKSARKPGRPMNGQ